MPLHLYKGKNHRCKRDRFIDSNGVPHDPAERGVVLSSPGPSLDAPTRQRIHAGKAGRGDDGAVDYRELGEGIHVIRWVSGITTAVQLAADPDTGRCRVVTFSGSKDSFRPAQASPPEFKTTHPDPAAGAPSLEAFPEHLKTRLSWSLRRRIDELCATIVDDTLKGAGRLRADARRSAAKLAKRGVVDPEFADVLAQLSHDDFNQSYLNASDRRNPKVMELYEYERWARIAERDALRISDGEIWPDVWTASRLGLGDDAIYEAVKDRENPVNVVNVREWELQEKERDGKQEFWPAFSEADISALKAAGLAAEDGRRWWNVGARDARTIDAMRAAGIDLDTAETYTHAGLRIDEMEAFHRSGLHSTRQVEAHIARSLPQRDGAGRLKITGPLY